MLLSSGDDFSRFSCWQEWAERHSLRTASEGGIVPDVFFQRVEDQIEISWGDRIQPGADAAMFTVEEGIARAPVDEVAKTLLEAVDWFLGQDGISESAWGAELESRWNEMRSAPRGKSALSWYLDSSPEPKSLTETFRNAMTGLGRPVELSGQCWLGKLAPEIAMFGDLAPDISSEAAARLLAEYFGARTNEEVSTLLKDQVRFDEPAWSSSSPWHSGYSLALDVLDELDPEPQSGMTRLEVILQNLGVTVREVRLGEEGPRGVALAGRELRPTILVNVDNRNNIARGKRFTLAHELCHILFDQSQARSLAHGSTPWASPSVEQRANAFAAMLLMPPCRAKRPSAENLDELKSGINRLADRMKVSRIALNRHLSNLDEIGPQELEHLLGTSARSLALVTGPATNALALVTGPAMGFEDDNVEMGHRSQGRLDIGSVNSRCIGSSKRRPTPSMGRMRATPATTHRLLAGEASDAADIRLITIEYDIREDKPELTTVIRVEGP